MSLGALFDKFLAAEGLVVNLVRDFPHVRAMREDGRRLASDIRLAWASIDASTLSEETASIEELRRRAVEARFPPGSRMGTRVGETFPSPPEGW